MKEGIFLAWVGTDLLLQQDPRSTDLEWKIEKFHSVKIRTFCEGRQRQSLVDGWEMPVTSKYSKT